MSTAATAEKPATEATPVETPPVETPPPAEKAPATIADIISGTSAISVQGKVTQASLKKPNNPEKVVEEKPPVVEEVVDTKEPPKLPDPSDKSPGANFARLRIQKEEAERKATEIEKSLAEVRAELEKARALEVPEAFTKKQQETEAALAQYQKELRAAALERDPEFQKKYNEGIKSKAQQMQTIAIQAGIPKEEIAAAFSRWDEDKFAEWMEGMPQRDKVMFNGAWQRALELEEERKAEISNADTTYKQWQEDQTKATTAQQAAYAKEVAGDVDAVFGELSETELLKGNAELAAETKKLLRATLGLDGAPLPRRDVLKIIGGQFALAKGFERQTAEITKFKADIAEKDAKIAELEEFVKQKGAATPRVQATSTAKAGETYVPPWNRVRVPGA
jgi:hypothetical protein